LENALMLALAEDEAAFMTFLIDNGLGAAVAPSLAFPRAARPRFAGIIGLIEGVTVCGGGAVFAANRRLAAD
jgi:hypothetical protein